MILVSVCSSVLQATAIPVTTSPSTLVSHADYNVSNYDINMECYWVIKAREEYTINFSIKEIDLEYDDDFFDYMYPNGSDVTPTDDYWCVTMINFDIILLYCTLFSPRTEAQIQPR